MAGRSDRAVREVGGGGPVEGHIEGWEGKGRGGWTGGDIGLLLDVCEVV